MALTAPLRTLRTTTPHPDDSGLLAAAAALLTANTREAWLDGRRYRFSVPACGHYPFPWLWDSCFHAIVWARIDLERAKDELRFSFAHQRADGMIPHVIFADPAKLRHASFFPYIESKLSRIELLRNVKPRMTAQSQPPVAAQAVEAIVQLDPNPLPYLAETLPSLIRLYRFWAIERDPDGDGLVSTISQFETGLDYSPMYDQALGVDGRCPYRLFAAARAVQWRNQRRGYDNGRLMAESNDLVEDALVNTVYIDGLHALARLATLAGNLPTAHWATAIATRATAALVERCWDGKAGIFRSLAGPKELRLDRVQTIQGLVPLLLPGLPSDVVTGLLDTLTDPKRFWTAFPVPSVAINEPSFLADSRLGRIRCIWRGPRSGNTDWLLWRGLGVQGATDEARALAASSRAQAVRHGFNEFHNALTSVPTGEQDFGWATIVACMS